jgi:hypothetical protein
MIINAKTGLPKRPSNKKELAAVLTGTGPTPLQTASGHF